MSVVYLAFGSNLGDRELYLRQAQQELELAGVITQKISKIIETKPQGGPPQGNYLNAVARATTELKPLELLELAKSIEKKLGREPTVRNGPRTIDIDILLYDRIKFQSPQLQIPHPQMIERDFVMAPLKEIAPEIVQELFNDRHPQHS